MGELFGAPVVEVPEDYLSAGVNFILLHKRAATAPEKIHDCKTHIDPPGISGNLVEGRFYYDLFVYGHKADGVYVDVTTSSSVVVLAAPTIAKAGGAITAAEGATAYYTTDGTDPRYSSTRSLVSSGASVTLEEGQTLRAYAFTGAKYPSPVVEKAYSA